MINPWWSINFSETNFTYFILQKKPHKQPNFPGCSPTVFYPQLFPQKNNQTRWKNTTWRIIPVSNWLGSHPFISHKKAICKGSHNPILRGLMITMVINHLRYLGWASKQKLLMHHVTVTSPRVLPRLWVQHPPRRHGDVHGSWRSQENLQF